MMRAFAFSVIAAVSITSAALGDKLDGYVVDSEGHCVASARVEAWDYTPMIEGHSEREVKIAKTVADSRGRFTISASSLRNVRLVARFEDQMGVVEPPLKPPVRIVIGPVPVPLGLRGGSQPRSSNQSMKPTRPLQENLSEFATTPSRGLSLSR